MSGTIDSIEYWRDKAVEAEARVKELEGALEKIATEAVSQIDMVAIAKQALGGAE